MSVACRFVRLSPRTSGARLCENPTRRGNLLDCSVVTSSAGRFVAVEVDVVVVGADGPWAAAGATGADDDTGWLDDDCADGTDDDDDGSAGRAAPCIEPHRSLHEAL